VNDLAVAIHQDMGGAYRSITWLSTLRRRPARR